MACYGGDLILSAIKSLKYELLVSMLGLVIWVSLFRTLKKNEKVTSYLPPGPRGLPLLGYLPFVRPDLHRFYAELAHAYGPIFSLRLGTKLCVVVSSPSLAKEIFKEQDTIFANPDAPVSGLIMGHGGSDIVWTPYGPRWRLVRKICVREVMASSRLDATYRIRRREVRDMVHDLYHHHKEGTPVDITETAFVTALNVISSMIWGGRLQGEEKLRVGSEFRRVVGDIVMLLAKPNVSDFFPLLARFDLQGVARETKSKIQWLDRIIDPMIVERLKIEWGQNKSQSSTQLHDPDILQTLVHIYKEGISDSEMSLTLNQIKGLIMNLVIGGTDTVSTTIEWTMAQMMKQPEIMRRAQKEVDQVVGLHQTVEEFHLHELRYLKAVVKEVLRLYSVAPILSPRSPSQTSILGGYTIPEGAQIIVNAWAIHRDPLSWEDPLEFRPERFLTNDHISKPFLNISPINHDFRYIPFGSGRRMCVGIPLGERMILLLLATLLHSFDWQLPQGTELDMFEKFGIAMKKVVPLAVVPTPRLVDTKLYI
ncbi:hypothetical protein H6P81_005349 [Aristolochia fimbriata]|uniref:Cytochrome P450 n=1 Tax=Aristolochia fimbriata TaxID=158543 RepID=A0AAV7EU60_ARIFI|nr:hypothetical protein H6P81_005349 [Aristolochia fimbriata]